MEKNTEMQFALHFLVQKSQQFWGPAWLHNYYAVIQVICVRKSILTLADSLPNQNEMLMI